MRKKKKNPADPSPTEPLQSQTKENDWRKLAGPTCQQPVTPGGITTRVGWFLFLELAVSVRGVEAAASFVFLCLSRGALASPTFGENFKIPLLSFSPLSEAY